VVGSNYINPKGIWTFNWFVLTQLHTCTCNMCFDSVSSLIGCSGGLIITAHTSPYEEAACCSLPLVIVHKTATKQKNSFLAYFMCILNSCVIYKFQAVNPGCLTQLHTFWLTAIRRDIRAALYFCSCEPRWRSTECVLLPVLTRCRIFLPLWTALC